MKKILLKTMALAFAATCVIGGAHAALTGTLGVPLSKRSTEAQTVDQVANRLQVRLQQNENNEFKVVDLNDLGGEMPMNVPARAAGEAPALIVGYAQMFDKEHAHECCMVSFQSDGATQLISHPSPERTISTGFKAVYMLTLFIMFIRTFPRKQLTCIIPLHGKRSLQ